jgi:serine/threonine protein kinase
MLGPYRIESLIGAGGMGEVYKAVDSRLDRTVAIKLLPQQLASDPDRRKRFEREAKAVSSLSHPRIAALYDVGEQNGAQYIVMELVEGQTLSDRLVRGKLSLRQTLEYAIQIAEALQDAHRRGVVHRDLKPGNIMITEAGVKLLDFGLAKLRDDAYAAARGAAAVTQRPQPLTSEGTIVGTVQYMAPEQLEGEDVDARADIFAFGSILYEMLSGQPAFAGSSAAGLTAAILTADPPPLSTLVTVPPALEHLVAVCMAKKRGDRWQTAHDVAKQLEWIRSSSSSSSPALAPAARASRGGTKWLIAAAVVIAAIAVTLGLAYRSSPPPPSQLMRFTVSFNDNVRYTVGEDFLRSASISPDGQRIVFTGADQTTGANRLYIRPVASEQVIPIEGSEFGTEPFWSPDSRSVGFYADGKVKLVSLDGGRPREIADATSTGGASWGNDGRILISLQNPAPLVLITAQGGAPTPVTTLDPATEVDHDWPQFLDDGVHFLYMARGRTAALNKVFVGSLKSPERQLLLEGVFAITYAPPNRVLFLRSGSLFAQELDTSRFELQGAPVALADNALPPFSASRTGALTYRTVPSTPLPLLWIDPDGKEIGTALPPGYYVDPIISPDGTQIALSKADSPQDNSDIWIVDVASGTPRRLTFDPANERAPVWSPDGKSIVYLAQKSDAPGLYRKNANGVGAEELVLASKGVVWPYQWKDGHLVYFDGISGANDVWMMSGDDLRERTPLIETRYNDVDGALSPDGRWLVYTANDSGRWELYLTTFPPTSTKLAVTTEGGADPVWNADGTQLYYTRPATAALMAMPVTPGDPPRFGAARRIHPGPLEYPAARSIDIDPSGERILVAPGLGVRGDLTVLVNWQSLVVGR